MKMHVLTLAVMIVPTLTGCAGMWEGKEAGDRAVAKFHEQLNDEKLAEIYADAHSKLKEATTEKEFLEFVGAVRRKLGKMTSTSMSGVNIKSVNLVTSIVMTQETTFEHGKGTETFTFELDGDRAVLVGYKIDSKDLIVK
jgi:hypothetical protein